jgi:hypothetical protein
MQDVNVELSQSPTNEIALNDVNVRSLFQVPSGTISLSDGYGKPSINNWMAYLNLGASVETYATSIAVDQNGNLYSVIYTITASAITKHNAAGSLQWAKLFDDAVYIDSIATDSIGNIYVAGSYFTSITSAILLKFNSSGSIVWQKTLDSPSDDAGFNGVAIDASDDVYVAGYSYETGYTGNVLGILVKYNSSGTLQWQKEYSTTSTYFYHYFKNIKIDQSTGNIYVSGSQYIDTVLEFPKVLFLILNSSGGVLLQRLVEVEPDTNALNSIDFDSSGNVYILAPTVYPGPSGLFCKFNSSGTMQWQKTDVPVGSINIFNGYIYVTGSPVPDELLISKYDLSGNLILQRNIATASVDWNGRLGAGFGSDFYVFGKTPQPFTSIIYDAFLAKLPLDGTKTGVYSPFTYSSTSYPDSVSAFTVAFSFYNFLTSSLVGGTSSVTVSNLGITNNLISV